MKNLTHVLLATLLISIPTTLNAQDTHVRSLIHGINPNIAESNFGIAGWIIAPNITNAPDKWLVIVGLRFDTEDWNIELLGGEVVNTDEIAPIVDFRFELIPGLWNFPLYVWGNGQVMFSDNNLVGYAYLQTDYLLPQGIALIGLETENVFQPGDNDLSAGSHVVIPMGGLTLVTAYQFHTEGENQLWFRAVLNL